MTVDGYNAIARSDEELAESILVRTAKKKWRYIELMVASGAVDNVSDPAVFPECFVRESGGSKRGLQ